MIEIINTYITMVLYIRLKQVSSESCVPFTNTLNYNILQELLFNRRFPSCGDVDFDQSRPICEVLYFLFFSLTLHFTKRAQKQRPRPIINNIQCRSQRGILFNVASSFEIVYVSLNIQNHVN